MERLERQAILLELIKRLRSRGSWCGETHIQKATYFLQDLYKVPLGFDFILYKHGPFSFDLRDEITAMRADSILKLLAPPLPYGPSLVPGENSNLVLDLFRKACERHSQQLQCVSDKLANKGVANLEQLATAFYVSQNLVHDEKTVEGRAKKIVEIKPHISLEQARSAVVAVDEMVSSKKSCAASSRS